MKLAVLLLLVSLGTFTNAQVTLTAYYVVPPTNGCNGLAAFGPASSIWQAPCAAPYLYVAEPDGCAQGAAPFGAVLWFSGDTMYANLCSIPCGITIYDASGECVILCQLPVIMDVAPSVGTDQQLLRLDPNPLTAGAPLSITTQGEAPTEITIMDARGRIVERSLLTSQRGVIGTTHLGAGLHVLLARWKDGRASTHRLLVQ